jgi:hypothetical protein
VFAAWRDGRLAQAISEADLPHPRKLERLALELLGHAAARKAERLH